MKKKEVRVDFTLKPIAPNPFTTRSGEMPRPYLGREAELTKFTEILGELDRNRKDHFIVIGEWGVGKTTFLQRCTELAGERNVVSAILKIPEYKRENKQIDVVVDIVKQLIEKLPVPHKEIKNFLKTIQSAGFSVGAGGVVVSREITDGQSFQMLLYRTLKELSKDLKKYTAVMILLDDVQNLRELPEVFTTFRNVLTEPEIVEKSNILWGMACTPKVWNKNFLTELHHPIGRYFIRINLKNFDEKTTETIVKGTIKDTGVEFSDKIISKIYEYTQGHAYELQVLCHHLYKNQLEGKVNGQQWEPSLNETLQVLGENVFNGWYERASKKEEEVLYAIAQFEEPVGFTEILKTSQLNEKELPRYLDRLEEKELLTRPRRGLYYIPDVLFRNYISLKNT